MLWHECIGETSEHHIPGQREYSPWSFLRRSKALKEDCIERYCLLSSVRSDLVVHSIDASVHWRRSFPESLVFHRGLSAAVNSEEKQRVREIHVLGRGVTHFSWGNRANHHDQIAILGGERDVLQSKRRILEHTISATMQISLNPYLPSCWELFDVDRRTGRRTIDCSLITSNSIRPMVFVGHEEFLEVPSCTIVIDESGGLTSIRSVATQYCAKLMQALEKLCWYVWRRYEMRTKAMVKKSVSNGACCHQSKPKMTKKKIEGKAWPLTILIVLTNDWQMT